MTYIANTASVIDSFDESIMVDYPFLLSQFSFLLTVQFLVFLDSQACPISSETQSYQKLFKD